MNKATNMHITIPFLAQRAIHQIMRGYNAAKWINFCATLIKNDYNVSLYEARKTKSKYITIYTKRRKFKVRFSDHKPIFQKEADGDCDFFVGVCNRQVTTSNQALDAVADFFDKPKMKMQNINWYKTVKNLRGQKQ